MFSQIADSQLLLVRFTTQDLDRYLLVGQLVFTENNGHGGATFIRFLKLAFKAATATVKHDLHRRQRVSQRLRQAQSANFAGFAIGDDIDISKGF